MHPINQQYFQYFAEIIRTCKFTNNEFVMMIASFKRQHWCRCLPAQRHHCRHGDIDRKAGPFRSTTKWPEPATLNPEPQTL